MKPIQSLPLLKTDGLPIKNLQPIHNVADLKTHGLSIEIVKPNETLTSLKTTGDLLECSLENDTPSEQVAQHTCDARKNVKPKFFLHRTYNATGFEVRIETERKDESRGKLSLITGRRRFFV